MHGLIKSLFCHLDAEVTYHTTEQCTEEKQYKMTYVLNKFRVENNGLVNDNKTKYRKYPPSWFLGLLNVLKVERIDFAFYKFFW